MARGKKTDRQRISAEERRVKALAYRKAGASYRSIAADLGSSPSTIVRDVHAALLELAQQQQAETVELRTLEDARLDSLQAAVWSSAMHGNVKAIQTVLRIMERRARLHGLDLQPGTVLLGDLEVTIRWPDDNRRTIIDATPIADHPAAAPQIAESGSDASGAVQGAGSGPALGQITACLSVMPDNGTE